MGGGGGGGGGGEVTGQWTIPPPRPRWGGWGLSLIGALDKELWGVTETPHFNSVHFPLYTCIIGLPMYPIVSVSP